MLTECLDHSTSHSLPEGLVLATCAHLLYRALTTQVTLAGFTMRDFSGSGYLEAFGYAFVSLSHLDICDLEQTNKSTDFLANGKPNASFSSIVNE